MSRLFDADGEYVDFGDGVPVRDLDPLTYLVWGKPNSGGSLASRMVSKLKREFLHAQNVNVMQAYIERATAHCLVQAPFANFAHHALDTWMLMATTLDTTTAGNNRILIGNLSNLAAEPSSYTTQTNGSGTVTIDSVGDFRLHVGNNVSEVRQFQGHLAWVGIWNRAMSVAEIQSQQFRPRVTSGCVLFTHLGYTGLSFAPDWSGNAQTGTIVNATVSDHVPLTFRRGRPLYAPYAVVAGAQQRFLLTRF